MKTIAIIFALILSIQASALAHAFLDHAEPKVGSDQTSPPEKIKIWFTEAIEPDFSVIAVYDSDGKQIDLKDSRVDDKDKTLLIVSLPKLVPGEYKVSWHVVASDTHKTKGDFKFVVKPQK